MSNRIRVDVRAGDYIEIAPPRPNSMYSEDAVCEMRVVGYSDNECVADSITLDLRKFDVPCLMNVLSEYLSDEFEFYLERKDN